MELYIALLLAFSAVTFHIYLTSHCLGDVACEKDRQYATPRFGIPEQKVALHVGVHYYIDKELMVNTLKLACISLHFCIHMKQGAIKCQ